MLVAVLVAVCAFAVMEPVTYLVHRYVMHGRGMVWHRSHHLPTAARFEANDKFPLVFAAVTIVAIALGFNVAGLAVLVPVGIGVTAYGAAYTYVHDGIIHRRFPVPTLGRVGRFLARAHALHHRFGGEPYGMLVPVVPAEIRQRARTQAPGRSAERVAEWVDAVPGA